ncbi:transmembrane protein 169 isoform X2 [Sinocyclocheilus rhinocerous]|uniref:transmembrane protein 169 isoform X2 n=1 Tax=Sinocyclocheilus rhinocerous TaxID=307959 RepID=UPI0007B95A16|nr:PREDICTED: transmembrane protein 169-like isoform X2 [Sinocyclocheilus rhinocerous]
MEQLRSDSPQLESVRSEVTEGQVDEGSSNTSTRRKRRKREHRPESIIVYRSDPERAAGEDHGGDSEGGERNSEEGATFLNNPSSEDSHYVTLTGTITRGRKKGQMVDIHVTLTERELQEMARSKEHLDAECDAREGSSRSCGFGLSQGPHVVLWSLSCAPVVFVLSFITSFYYGTLTWYNIFLVYNEERTFCHKITVCPFLIIFYPGLIVALSLSLGLYSAVAQVSWAFSEWWLSVRDLEKGFCGWACGKLGLEDCSPYSVVELLDSDTISGSLQGKSLQTSSV